MCLAVPGKILEINGETALVDFGGIKKHANISFVDCNIGDYVLVHVGFAIEKVDQKKAEEHYRLLWENG